MISEGFSRIPGKRVFLRKFTLEDTEKVFQMSRENGMKKWIPDQVYADLQETESLLKYLIEQYDSPDGPDKVPIVLAVCLQNTGELIGHAGLSPADGQVEIGYAIEEAQQRQGYASDAISAYCKWALSSYRLSHIVGIVASDNVASCRTLARAGFELIEEKERILHGVKRQVKIYHITI